MEQEPLKQLFREVDLVLMPSRSEGFGLTGVESLSAGLHVLVSKNSGFGEALGSVPFGFLFVIDSEDPSKWTTSIEGIWNRDRKLQLEEVKAVRCFYGERYSWSEQCKHLIEKMFKLVDGMNYIDSTSLLIKVIILKKCSIKQIQCIILRYCFQHMGKR